MCSYSINLIMKTAISKFDKSSFKRTPEGYLDAAVQPTRAGVFTYWYGGQMVRELRRPEEVFKADSLSQLINKPVTNDHPKDRAGNFVFLDVNNAKDYELGQVYGEHKKADDGIHTQARVIIKDAQLIDAIESGKVQVSCGYECNYKEEPGEWQGIKYDREQIDITNYNHLAVVKYGRAGSGASIKFDGLEIDPDEINETSKIGDQPMINIKLDGADIQVSEESAQAIIEVEAKRKADALEITELTSKVDSLTKERDELNGKFDALNAELEVFQKAQTQAKHDALITEASAFVDADKLQGLNDRQVKEAVIASKLDAVDFEQKTDANIDGMYEVVIAHKPEIKETENLKKIDSAINQGKPLAGVDLISAARQQGIRG